MFKMRLLLAGLCLVLVPSLVRAQSSTPAGSNISAQKALYAVKAASPRSVTNKDLKTQTRTITIKRRGVITRYTQKIKVTPKVSNAAVRASATPSKSSAPGARTVLVPFKASTGLVHPQYGGPSTTVVTSQDFGTTHVGGTSVVQTLTYPAPTTDTTLSFTLSGGVHFSVQAGSCTATECTATVTFTPLNPGRLNDALSVTDSNQNLLDQTFLSGIGTGPQFAFQLGEVQPLDLPFEAPTGAAFGPDGSYYVVDSLNKSITIGGGARDIATIPIAGLCTPAGIAVDGSGTIYIADPFFNRVLSISSQGVESVVPTTPLLYPAFVAVDGTGALYISDTGNNRVIKLDNHNAETTVLSGLNAPAGIAVDADGDLFFGDQNAAGEIKELQASSGQVIPIANQLGTIQAVATDASGRVFYTTVDLLGIINPATGDSFTMEGDEAREGPNALAVAPDGRLLTTLPTGGVDITLAASGEAGLSFTPINTTTPVVQTIVNNGNSALTFSSITTQGAPFTVDSATQCHPEMGLAAGATCDVTIDFTPTQANDYFQYLTATSNSLNVPGTQNTAILEGVGEGVRTNTTITVSPVNGPLGATITLSAAVTQVSSHGVPAPTGSVTFYASNTIIGTADISGGTAVLTTNQLPAGTYTFFAIYFGDDYNAISESNEVSGSVGIGTGDTSVTLTPSASTLALNQPETLTFTITGQGSATPTGTISFVDDDVPLGTAQLTGTGNVATATLTVNGLTGGQNRIYGSFPGDPNYAPTNSGEITVQVTPGPSATALTITPSPATTTQAISLTAAITSGTNPFEEGIVVFSDQNGELGTVYTITPTSTGGTATLTIHLSVGTHQITAHYTDDESYTDSTSPVQTVVVSPGGPALNFTVSAANINVGQTEILTLAIGAGETPAETGTVTFSDQNGVLGIATVCACNPYPEATLALSTLSAGVHQITATYNGDANYGAATSASQTVTVGSATSLSPTTTALSISAAAINQGQPEILTATVTNTGTSVPTGTVTFADLDGILGTVTLAVGTNGNQASITLSTLSVGTHQITATYGGNSSFASSVSQSQLVVVTLVLTPQTITFPAIPNHQVADAPFVLSATASSGLPITYTVLSGPATISGSTVILAGSAGAVVIQASQPGNSIYAPALPVTQSFLVTALPVLTLTGVTPNTAVAGSAALSVTLMGANFSTSDVVLLNGSTIPSTYVGATALTATLPATFLATAGTGTLTVKDNQANLISAGVTFTVTPAPVLSLTSITPSSGAIGSPATTITLTGTDFNTGVIVLLNGAQISSTYVNVTTLTATLPASFFNVAGTGTLTVSDLQSQKLSSGVTFTVSTSPQIVFTGPTTAISGQQPQLTFQLVNPYPIDLAGALSLTFAPSTPNGINDPSVQFASGGRSLPFNIPADSITTPLIQLQTGTVAGTATISLAVLANGVVVTPANLAPVIITIPAAPPTITSTSLTRNGDTLTVSVVGYSNTREATQATFHFDAVPGSTVDNPDLTLTIGTNFAGWYATPASDSYGSAFTYTQDFMLTQGAALIQDVTVTLTNTIGSSAPAITQ